MYRVLVIDDEPSAVDYICNLIKLKCPNLTVAGTAENGREGLEQYQSLKPDLVISDVKMPVLNGLDMVKQIKEACRDAQILLVSGYQEFEYVKAALKYGVSDYVLKPMTPAGFTSALEPIIGALNKRTYEQRRRLVRAMVNGEPAGREPVEKYFPESAYYLAVIRENGLPRRFTGTYEIEVMSEVENTIFVYGRDDREALYICPSQAVSETGFSVMMQKEAVRKRDRSNFVTAVLMPCAVETGYLSKAIPELYRCLNRQLSIGNSRNFTAGEDGEPEENAAVEQMVKSMERCLEKKDCALFLDLLWNFLKSAGEAGYPQLNLERIIRRMAVEARQNFDYSGDLFEEEMMFEDAFYYAGSMKDLYESLSGIFMRYWKADKESVKLDSPEFLTTIRNYIERHLEEELTVSSVCREFALSQSYLNLIFRKYGMQSFNAYVRNTRIERAKQIMERTPQMFIKDVAVMAGYKDQFYFSRIFRAVTGMSPSEYIDRIS